MSAIKTVVVCEAQVPFVRGGAEALVRELVRQLRIQGFDAERVSLPFKWYPKEEILAHAAAWRLLDLSESNGKPIDLLIGTKFPTYLARHPRKVTWLVHQHRGAYELVGTPYSNFAHDEHDVALRERLLSIDTTSLGESRGLYSISATIANRLQRYNGLTATPLYHPPRLADRFRAGEAGHYVLSVGRLETVKRVDLAIKAMTHLPASLSLVIAGAGSHREPLEALVASLGLGSRVQFLGEATDDQIVDLYAGALAVIFPPFDEDYGYVTLEAFLSHKPVVTTKDAGGPNEFVRDGMNGCVTDPDPKAIAQAVAGLDADRRRAARMGDAGYDLAREFTWTTVIERLTAAS
ncbi:MAG TPA: glycosyltransferase family 4 protein [Vicinamibacterales bacterium]|nr:glycosyltransferase family 4 protein [Vicinamibacterales bacterium]